MKFDVNITPASLNDALRLATHAEALGAAGIWTTETTHNPFLPLTLAASVTERIGLGTGIAVAFARSPMVTAQLAWDLAAQSNGRFILGLGTQVKAHMTKRFGMDWSAPAPRIKEYVQMIRAVWGTFQHNEAPDFRGESYTYRLMTPFFNPGPIAHPDIPIYIAGVNEAMCRTVGEVADGLHVHPFHTARYLEEVILPNLEAGAARNAKTLADIERYCAVFVVTNAQEAVDVKRQIAFYASTPGYRAVMDLHGWGDIHERLYSLSRQGEWETMWQHISDEMLEAFAVVAAVADLAKAAHTRYDGLLTRLSYYFPYDPADVDRAGLWQDAVAQFRQ